ncbi:Golgi transport complex subunit 5-domain-containing protein [Thermothelomyces heterothallicus CBS 202.75]|uniref:Golgi transport complex subunit 5-domain-containing protein n=1 Tax=Thermothelomyces heterothallicus CBS 202.75 TaxID=1149848 RepID=UPI003743C160
MSSYSIDNMDRALNAQSRMPSGKQGSTAASSVAAKNDGNKLATARMSTQTTPTGPATLDDSEPSYIDYETFLDPSFTPASFANTLVLATNNPSDTPLDLSTPLSRVLFDIQEIDSHIDSLTSRSALPLLQYTQDNAEASNHILAQLQTQITALNDSYAQLDREVTQKHAEADQVRAVASRLWDTLRLARAVSRCLQLGRRLEAQHAELIGTTPAASGSTSTSTSSSSSSSSSTTITTTTPPPTTTTSATASGPGRAGSGSSREDHRALVRCAHTLLALREVFAGAGTPGAEGYGLDRVGVVRTLREGVVGPIERAVRETAERVVREFSMMGGVSSSTSSSSSSSSSSSLSMSATTFAQLEETKARTVSALVALWLLTPAPTKSGERWVPSLMLQALEGYLRSALQSSIAGLSRALATLPSLERTLAEVSARCQNVVALEAVLEGTKPPAHPGVPAKQAAQVGGNMLQPLLTYLETGSLASYYWRTMASSLAPRVQEIIAKGGVSARTLRTNRQSVGDAIRECVARGSQLPSAVTAAARGTSRASETKEGGKHWEREVAVMVASVVNNLGR